MPQATRGYPSDPGYPAVRWGCLRCRSWKGQLQQERQHEQDDGGDERDLCESGRKPRDASEPEESRDEGHDGQDDKDFEELTSHG